MHVYLAGPMRGYPEFNFPAFRECATFLRFIGYDVTSPAEMDEDIGFDAAGTLEEQEFSVTDAMRRDFQVILDVDGVVLMPGWDQSTGARAERFVAEQTGKVVRYLKPCGGSYSVVNAPEWSGDPRKPIEPPAEVLYEQGSQEPRDCDHEAGFCSWNAPPQRESFDLEQQRAFATIPAVVEAKRVRVVTPAPGTAETRVVDPTTGGEKGSKLARYDLIPADVLEELAEHYGRGARKYADRNWEKGYAWSLSYAALMRHLQAFWQQEDIDHDPVIGDSPHIIAVVWHAMALAAFSFRHDGTDDRP